MIQLSDVFCVLFMGSALFDNNKRLIILSVNQLSGTVSTGGPHYLRFCLIRMQKPRIMRFLSKISLFFGPKLPILVFAVRKFLGT